jgi:hypothetical protein
MREFYCHDCGLFFWEETRPSGYSYICPECKKSEDAIVFAVDTFAFAYFAESNSEAIKGKSWSSLKYAPDFAINHYKMQNVEIRK